MLFCGVILVAACSASVPPMEDTLIVAEGPPTLPPASVPRTERVRSGGSPVPAAERPKLSDESERTTELAAGRGGSWETELTASELESLFCAQKTRGLEIGPASGGLASGAEPDASVEAAPAGLNDVDASRAFAASDDDFRNAFAGFGLVAFKRSPRGSLSQRAMLVCKGFLTSLSTVEDLTKAGSPPDRQVVTVWPVRSASIADDLNHPVDQTEEERCGTAIEDYDSLGAERAIEEATRLFSAKDKADVAARISSSQRGGPWPLAWAPGAKKGSAEDDVLVLAFELSHIRTEEQAEQAFQGWRDAIEFDPDLWRNNTIANEA